MVKDFILELLRVGLIAALPVVYLSFEAGNIDIKAISIAVVIAVLKAIDRALHESGIAEKGLTRF